MNLELFLTYLQVLAILPGPQSFSPALLSYNGEKTKNWTTFKFPFPRHSLLVSFDGVVESKIPPITYYWTGLLILDHSYLLGNLTNSKIAEIKALEPLNSWHFCISNFRTCKFPKEIWVAQDYGYCPKIGDRGVLFKAWIWVHGLKSVW